jgi:2'-5' RNA ligase
LLPPTEVPAEQLGEVEEHLKAVAEAGQPFEMELRGTGTFRPASPVVFVQVARGIGECEQVEPCVRSGPLARALRFPYHPHVTVAHDVREADLDRAYAELAGWSAAFWVWGFCLYEHGEDGVWRPQRDYVFGRTLPGPATPD